MRFFHFFSFAANYSGVQHLVEEEGDDFYVACLGGEVERRVSLGVGGVVPTHGFPYSKKIFFLKKTVCFTYSIFGMSSKSSSISIMPLPQRWLTGVCKNEPK